MRYRVGSRASPRSLENVVSSARRWAVASNRFFFHTNQSPSFCVIRTAKFPSIRWVGTPKILKVPPSTGASSAAQFPLLAPTQVAYRGKATISKPRAWSEFRAAICRAQSSIPEAGNGRRVPASAICGRQRLPAMEPSYRFHPDAKSARQTHPHPG